MSWLNRVRNSHPLPAEARDAGQSLAQMPANARRWSSPRNMRRISTSARAATITAGSARRGASSMLLDPGYTVLPPPQVREDPLKFRDSKRYTDRIKAARAATGEPDALINARGAIEGRRTVIGVQDFAFMGGSMGMAVGAAFVAGARAAIADRCPYIIVTAAGGARMQEGIFSLMQMPKATVAIAELKEAGLPYIVLLADPTTGGVTASYAMLGDVQIAEPGALIGFAGQRVIEITIREKLPEGFQRAEYLLDHGMVDMVVHRKELRARLALLLDYLAPRKAADGRSSRPRSVDRMPTAPVSDHPAVQAQLDRLALLSPGRDILGLERIAALLDRLGNPERALPPVLHVAGTNGKGSTCAFLRAAIEAAGLTRPRLYQPASRPLQRAHPPRRPADRGRGARRPARRDARRRRRHGDQLLRGDHGRRLPRLRAHARRRLHRRGRPRRPARRDQRHRRRPLVCGIAQLGHDHHAFLGDTARADRRRESRHRQARRAAGHPALSRPRSPSGSARRRRRPARRWLPRGGALGRRRPAARLRYRDARGRARSAAAAARAARTRR